MPTKHEHWVTSGDLLLYAVAEGNPEATPIVLVHGYPPDNHSVWDKVTATLSQEYLVIRYDVRGAGRSDKPARTWDYRLSLLAKDLQAVVNAIIPPDRPFHLVAHDWGGSIQSWESVTDPPDLQQRIRSYTSISGPPCWIMSASGFAIRSAHQQTAVLPRYCGSWRVPGTYFCSSCRYFRK